MKTCFLTGVRRIARFSRSVVSNLWSGFRLLCFWPVSARDFTLSALHLWAAALVVLLTFFGMDYFYSEQPRQFFLYAIEEKAVWFGVVLLAGGVTSLFTGKHSSAWAFPVVFLNALWIPTLVHGVILASVLSDDSRDYKDYREFMYIAVFVITFRAIICVAAVSARRQLFAALACSWLFYLTSGYFFYSSFWYKPDNDDALPSSPSLMAEDALSDQSTLLEKQLAALEPRRKGKRNYFIVTYGSDDAQDVFMKEALFARSTLEKKLDAAGHVLTLINNPAMLNDFPLASVNGVKRMFQYLLAKHEAQVEKKDAAKAPEKTRYPLATVTNLYQAVKALGSKADPLQDVLVLYLTSHGGRDSTISVQLSGVPLRQLTAEQLKHIVTDSGFKWKILVISACFSGSFVDSLKDDNTLIITSSREDRVSYGCGKDDRLTYFGRAFLEEALPQASSFITAYEMARESIEHREDDERIHKHSQPQLYVGRKVRDFLK